MPALSRVAPATTADADAIERLLHETYVGGGFTDPDLARTMFAATNVLARGEVLLARDGEVLAGMVVVACSSSPARRLAVGDEVEMHLLAVAPAFRRAGIGALLVTCALDHARARGASRMLLWTQPSMTSAQRLYERAGFVRMPGLDFERGGRRFLVLARELSPPTAW